MIVTHKWFQCDECNETFYAHEEMVKRCPYCNSYSIAKTITQPKMKFNGEY